VLCALYCDALDAFITGGDDHSIRIWPVAADEPGAERADKPADKILCPSTKSLDRAALGPIPATGPL